MGSHIKGVPPSGAVQGGLNSGALGFAFAHWGKDIRHIAPALAEAEQGCGKGGHEHGHEQDKHGGVLSDAVGRLTGGLRFHDPPAGELKQGRPDIGVDVDQPGGRAHDFGGEVLLYVGAGAAG